MEMLSERIKLAAEKKDLSAAEWLSANLENMKRYIRCSHIAKYTDPGVSNAITILDESESEDRGFVTTSNTGVRQDIVVDGGASYMSLAALLLRPINGTGKTVLQCIQDDDIIIRQEIESFGGDYKRLREAVLSIRKIKQPTQSDSRIKQVYFPTGDNAYHLLSTLTSTTILSTIKEKIITRNQHYWKNRDKKAESYGKPCSQVINLTQINYGGAQPQNMSVSNSKGGFLVLLSAPPRLNHQNVHPPQEDFFKECVHPKEFRWEFHYLHSIFKENYNNAMIRDTKDKIVQDVVCSVLLIADKIRESGTGWSESGVLPLEQRIWLDNDYTDAWNPDHDWVEKISKEFSRWFYNSYCYLLKKNAYKMSDAELGYFTKQLREALLREVREGL
jgi:CRISPR-associated protein Csy1